jgi:hypothetical protein
MHFAYCTLRGIATAPLGHSRRFERPSGTSAVASTAEAACLAGPARRQGAMPDTMREPSEIGRHRLRYGQRRCARKEGVRIIGADQLCERAFRRARQLRDARDPGLAHRRLVLPEALDGVPGRRKRTGVLDVNVRLARRTRGGDDFDRTPNAPALRLCGLA